MKKCGGHGTTDITELRAPLTNKESCGRFAIDRKRKKPGISFESGDQGGASSGKMAKTESRPLSLCL